MIGKTIWVFDENHRVYPRDDHGRTLGPPIWREFWRKMEVLGETQRKWLIGFPGSKHLPPKPIKIPKKGSLPWGFAWDEAEIDRLVWIHDHRHKIAESVRQCSDYEILVQIERLIGLQRAAP